MAGRGKKPDGKPKKGPEKIDMRKELARATRDMERNKRLIEADETFRSRRRRGLEKPPSQYKPFR